MARPSNEGTRVRMLMDKFGNVNTSDCIRRDVCVKCGDDVITFKNYEGKRIYRKIGYCQICQDNHSGLM